MPTKRIFFIPVGMIPLASLIEENGIKTEIIHYGITPVNLSSEETLLFDLHWHDQCVPVIDMCKKLKAKKILGGFTATYYKDEILRNYPVDYIVSGYGEEELLYILTGKRIKIDINDLKYSNFKIIRDYEKYIENKLFVFSPGRGCPVNCTYCGGNNRIQKLCGLDNPIFLKKEKVIEELKNAKSYGIDKWLVSFDPEPKGNYYIELFKDIDFEIKCQFDCWGLPTKNFIDVFSKTFVNESEISISPKIGVEELRNINKGFSFKNSELFKIIEYMERLKVQYKIFLATNFPEDTIEYLTKNIDRNNLLVGDIVKEPGSDICDIKNFKTLYNLHKFGMSRELRTIRKGNKTKKEVTLNGTS